ncbi:hypothetical protein CMQ_7031 [Grosmannia clavigera kw1407]|uniref:Uncharacterized protein n=1 Tax=Grosmannia clavigera (strain kw1407 / UAMH 11150) TaxID=655863 RepID=F0X6I3_GROCL|nr:uncharacterized protein CMQ_7031 [Grosmannia clavigera kw1407]EFX06709.1 hypothetical protein CMQ_7031 [Grosmannia clavigera kw1407]
MAERTQFRIIAKLLWAYDTTLLIDPVTGALVAPNLEAYNEGLIAVLKPFKVDFRLRSPEHKAVSFRDMEASMETLRKYE